MRSTMTFRGAAICFAVIGLASCAQEPLEPLPFQISIETSRATAAPGDTVIFTAVVQGGSLLGLVAEFGDGSSDSYGTSGARTGRVGFRHAYTTRGTFTTTITVTDATAGQKSASVQTRVQ